MLKNMRGTKSIKILCPRFCIPEKNTTTYIPIWKRRLWKETTAVSPNASGSVQKFFIEKVKPWLPQGNKKYTWILTFLPMNYKMCLVTINAEWPTLFFFLFSHRLYGGQKRQLYFSETPIPFFSFFIYQKKQPQTESKLKCLHCAWREERTF